MFRYDFTYFRWVTQQAAILSFLGTLPCLSQNLVGQKASNDRRHATLTSDRLPSNMAVKMSTSQDEISSRFPQKDRALVQLQQAVIKPEQENEVSPISAQRMQSLVLALVTILSKTSMA